MAFSLKKSPGTLTVPIIGGACSSHDLCRDEQTDEIWQNFATLV